MEVHRPVKAAVNVVLAGPLQLHGDAVGSQGLRDRDCLGNVVGYRVRAASKTAAGVERMNLDLLSLEPGRLGRVGLIDRLKLISGPDLAVVGCQLDDGIQG